MAASAWSFLVAASASFSSASARLVRISLSDLTWASCTRACASRSLVSCSVETMRMTLPRSSFWRPRVSRMVSRACSQVTLRKDTETLPLTSSPATILRPLSAARMRSRLTTSASLKSSEMSRWPFPVGGGGEGGEAGGGVGVAWAGTGTSAIGARVTGLTSASFARTSGARTSGARASVRASGERACDVRTSGIRVSTGFGCAMLRGASATTRSTFGAAGLMSTFRASKASATR